VLVLCAAFMCLSDRLMLPLYTMRYFVTVPVVFKLNDDDDNDEASILL